MCSCISTGRLLYYIYRPVEGVYDLICSHMRIDEDVLTVFGGSS